MKQLGTIFDAFVLRTHVWCAQHKYCNKHSIEPRAQMHRITRKFRLQKLSDVLKPIVAMSKRQH